MDFGLTDTYKERKEVGMMVRLQGEPILGEQRLPVGGGYKVRFGENLAVLERIEPEGRTATVLAQKAYTLDAAKTYNLKTVVNENTISAYLAVYEGGVLGEYELVLTAADTGEFQPEKGYFAVYQRLSYNNNDLNFMPQEDVMWLDNVKVDRIITPFMVTSANVPQNGGNVSKNQTVEVYFSSKVTLEQLQSGAVTLMDETKGAAVPAGAFQIALGADQKTAKITMPKEFVYNHTYALTIQKELLDVFGTQLGRYQGGDYTLRFTIEPEPVSVSDLKITDLNGAEAPVLSTATGLKLTVTLRNLYESAKPVYVIAAAYGEDDELLGYSSASGTAQTGETAWSGTMELRGLPAGTKNVKVFVWDSVDSLIPYCAPRVEA